MGDWPQPWRLASGEPKPESEPNPIEAPDEWEPFELSGPDLDGDPEESDEEWPDEEWSVEPFDMTELLEAADFAAPEESAEAVGAPADLPAELDSEEPDPGGDAPPELDPGRLDDERPVRFVNEPATANHIAFQMGETLYAVPMENVLELDRVTPITPVPNTPDFVLGVTNLHGEITSVVDLRPLFGLPPTARLETSRLIKLRNDAGGVTTGAVVDKVQGMRAILVDRLEDLPPSDENDFTRRYVSAGETIEVLDVDRLLDSEPMRRLMGV